MSQSETPKAPTQAPRDEKPPGKEEPLFTYRTGPNGEPQRFYNRDPAYGLTVQSPREGQPQRRPQQSMLVQQQQVQSGSYTDLGPAARRFGGSMHMPGYQGKPGSYGDVRAAVAPSDRVQAQSGSYLASYGSASRSTDGAPWSGSSYGAVASRQATTEAEYLCEYLSHQQGASGSYSSASGREHQPMAPPQQQSGSYRDFDFRVGPHVDFKTQTMYQPQSQSGIYRCPSRDSPWRETNESAGSLYKTTQAARKAGHSERARQGPGHYAPEIDPRRHREWNAPLHPDRWSPGRRSRSPQRATGEETDEDAISALEGAREDDETDVVEPGSFRLEVLDL